jgi:hypothetical protein
VQKVFVVKRQPFVIATKFDRSASDLPQYGKVKNESTQSLQNKNDAIFCHVEFGHFVSVLVFRPADLS